MPIDGITSFTGYLKQMSMADVGETDQRLFSDMFPNFMDRTGFSWDSHQDFRAQFSGAADFVKFAERRVARRYGGLSLPRGRYSTLCEDAGGNDHGTLINELAAYRDPVHSGRIDIMDFGLGETGLRLPGRDLTFDRAHQLGIVVLEWQRYSHLLQNVFHERIEVTGGHDLVLLRYPYRVREVRLSRVIDLRLPTTRAWFHGAFSKPNADWAWEVGQDGLAPDDRLMGGPQTFHSPFEYEDRQAPVPRTFAEMLPTLLNGELGGGGRTGMTLMGIGETLRNQGVDALIYPSARSDAFALINQGELQRFGGWCLVDLRPAEDAPLRQHVVIDRSPWSWTGLPAGVTVMEAPPGQQAGTFGIDGMEERNSSAYLQKLKCILTCRSLLGPERAPMSPPETLAIGGFLFRWLSLAIAKEPAERVEEAFEIAFGLLLRNGRTSAAERLQWVYDRVAQTGELQEAIKGLSEVQDAITSTLPPGSEARDILAAAADISFVHVLLAHRSKSGQAELQPGLATPGLNTLQLPPLARAHADGFTEMLADVRTHPDEAAESALRVLDTLADVYESRGEEATAFFEQHSISIVGVRSPGPRE